MENVEPLKQRAPDGGAPYSYRRIEGRSEFRSAVVDAVNGAADAGFPEMTWCDPNFAQWPLSDPVLLAALVRWGLPRRKLLLLAHDFDEIPRLHPAFARWRQQWSHVVECRELCDIAPTAVRTMLLVCGLTSLKLADGARFVGVVSSLADDMNRVLESIEAVSQRSQPGFPATVLGL